MSKKRRGNCVFCGTRTDMTIEDVFPHWAANELKRLYPHQYVTAVETVSLDEAILISNFKRWGSAAAVKLPLVCCPCNKRFGNKLEKPTSDILKPALGGVTTPIRRKDCELLAAWGMLKALCYDIIDPDPGRVVYASELHAFRTQIGPAPRFQMWFGQFQRHESELAFHVRDHTVSPFDYPGFPSGTPHAQVLTRILGDLVVQSVFVGIRGRRVEDRYDRPQNETCTIRIWPPPTEPQTWPPPEPITRETLPAFAGFPESLIGQVFPDEPDSPEGTA